MKPLQIFVWLVFLELPLFAGCGSFATPSRDAAWGPESNGLRISLARIQDPKSKFNGCFQATYQNVGETPIHIPVGLDLHGDLSIGDVLKARLTDPKGHSIWVSTDEMSYSGAFWRRAIPLPSGCTFTVLLGRMGSQYDPDWPLLNRADQKAYPIRIRVEHWAGFFKHDGFDSLCSDVVVSNELILLVHVDPNFDDGVSNPPPDQTQILKFWNDFDPRAQGSRQ